MYFIFNRMILPLAATIALVAGSVNAETRYDAKAQFSGKNQSVHHELMDGYMGIMGVNTVEQWTTEDPDNPQNGATGTCFGLFNITPDGDDANGYCSMTDRDGDKWASSWTLTGTNEDGSINYDWEMLGGSGKWKDATGGGTLRQVFSENKMDYTDENLGEFILK
jgi:hypothetical protein